MSYIVCVNVKFIPFNKAQTSIERRGYQFLDGIHKVISLIQRHLVDLGKRIKRLEKSFEEIHIIHQLKEKH